VRARLPFSHLGIPLLALVPLLGCARVESESVPPATENHFRLATWNIRFFPEPSTDRERTGKILADLDADLIAVQEIADSDSLAAMLEAVNARLAQQARASGLTSPRRYEHILAESGGHGGQFVGYIYDQNAVSISDVETLTRLQMTPDLRPGLFARVTSLRGGLDFQVIVMHTDSGTKDRDYQNRLRFMDSLAVELSVRGETDSDVIVLGDLNTMGRLADEELARVTAEEEIADLDAKAGEMGLRRLPVSPSCTEYYQGKGSFLDHILVSRAMTEAPSNAVARVAGYCAVAGCQPVDPDLMPYDYRHVSDHCPVVIDLTDVDRD
jgi:endonuclease/exonuclease/phosphatase family metal-dependent hydrolase